MKGKPVAYANGLPEGRLGEIGGGALLFANHAYDGDAICAKVAEQGALTNSRLLSFRKDPVAFSPKVYKMRNLVERNSSISGRSQPGFVATRAITPLQPNSPHYGS